MYLHPLLVSPLVTFLVMGIVYTDTKRRALELRTRLLWTIGVGLVSLGGFLGAFVFDSVLSRAYFRAYVLILGRPVVVQSPREFLLIPFMVGTTVSAIAVLVYGIRSRFAPLKTRSLA
ncbi:hypothetical protein [Natrinema gelatinilyticum]|uniref:hypothetical protein n=1 Tax=Natrinema gelatinilyticum TaxID=2961571 RepID=UPI0020C4BE79|nr:hypothetical protein [Natrinema gelatinilyticum]